MKTVISIALFSSLAIADSNIDVCLNAWGKHPFPKNPKFRTLKTNVKVLGIGSAVKDERETSRPDLVLVKASVAVMSKQVYRLMNPNGWYCLVGPVAVLGKAQIELHCNAHLAGANDGVSVAASNESGGVAVLGSIRVVRVGCS